MAQRAPPEGCFCWMADFTGQLPQGASMGAELFLSLHLQCQQLESPASGVLGRYILFTDNPTGVFRTVRCLALRGKSTGPPITVVRIISAQFTNCLPGALGNGTGE